MPLTRRKLLQPARTGRALSLVLGGAALLLVGSIWYSGGPASAASVERPGSEIGRILDLAAQRAAVWENAGNRGQLPALDWSIAADEPVLVTDNPALSLGVLSDADQQREEAIFYASDLLAAWTYLRRGAGREASPARILDAGTGPAQLISRPDMAELFRASSVREPQGSDTEAALMAMARALVKHGLSGGSAASYRAVTIDRGYANKNNGRMGAYGLSIYNLAAFGTSRTIRVANHDEQTLMAAVLSESESVQFSSGTDLELAVSAADSPRYLAVLNPNATTASYDLRMTTGEADGVPSGQLAASPNPVQFCGSVAGQTTITWATQSVLSAEVRVGTPTGALFAQALSGAISAPWINKPTLFFLIDTSGGRNVELTRLLVEVTDRGCTTLPTGVVAASPNPVQVCTGGAGRTTLTWSTRNSLRAEIRVGTPSGRIFAAGGQGTADAPWIQGPVVFYLVETLDSGVLIMSQTLVDVTTQGCAEPVSGNIAATPSTVQFCGATAGRTTITWSTKNATSAEVHVGTPTGPLFANAISGSADATWIQQPTLFYLINTTGGAYTELGRALVEVTSTGCPLPPAGQIQASPNPAQFCFGIAGSTVVTWNTQNVKTAEIRINSADGALFAQGLAGSQNAPFINQAYLFILFDTTGGSKNELARTFVGVDNRNCP